MRRIRKRWQASVALFLAAGCGSAPSHDSGAAERPVVTISSEAPDRMEEEAVAEEPRKGASGKVAYPDRSAPGGDLYEAAMTAEGQGNVAGARAALTRLLREHPDSPWVSHAYLALAESHFAEGNLHVAEEFFEQAVAVDDPRIVPYALYKLAWVRFSLGDKADALNTLVEARNRALGELMRVSNPESVKSLLRETGKDLPRFFEPVGDPAKAAAFFGAVAQSDDERDRMLDRLAEMYEEVGKLRDAILVREALALGSDSGCDHLLRIVALWRQIGDAAQVSRAEAAARTKGC